jgi:hypothetical protein
MEKSIDVDVPVQRANNQWTQFGPFRSSWKGWWTPGTETGLAPRRRPAMRSDPKRL